MQKMAFNDLKAQYKFLQKEIDAQIAQVLQSGQFISGEQIQKLEEELCTYTGRKFCVTVSNGTDALRIPLMAENIGKGDAVFVPSFTFVATAEVVSLCGATPVFCDVCRDSFNIDPESLEKQIKKVQKEGQLRPRMVIAVDLFGQPADYGALTDICEKYQLLLLEDGAQGFGGAWHGKKACSFGKYSTTSFFPAKPLGCYGDGGAIFTDDEQLYKKFCSIRVHGKGHQKYDNVRVGLNARLDTLQAAVLLPKLHIFDKENEARNKAAKFYSEQLASKYEIPKIPNGFFSSWAQYTVRAESKQHREYILKVLKENGIPAMVYYPKPLHLQKVYQSLGYQKGCLPVSEQLSQTVFSLPMHAYMQKDVQQYICDVLNSIKEDV